MLYRWLLSGLVFAILATGFSSPEAAHSVPITRSLETAGAASGIGVPGGHMFDVVALNDLTITGFALGGLNDDISIFAKAGTHVGFEESPGSWTLLTTQLMTFSSYEWGNGMWYSRVNIPHIALSAGERFSFYLQGRLSIAPNVGIRGDVSAANADLEILKGLGLYSAWDTTPYGEFVVTGSKIYYEVASTPEPSTFTLVALSLLGLGLGGRRRQPDLRRRTN